MEVDPKNSELTRQREGEALTRAQKKAKKSSRADLDCRHGCGCRGGPISQHEAACKGKSEEIQKNKGKAPGSKVPFIVDMFRAKCSSRSTQ